MKLREKKVEEEKERGVSAVNFITQPLYTLLPFFTSLLSFIFVSFLSFNSFFSTFLYLFKSYEVNYI